MIYKEQQQVFNIAGIVDTEIFNTKKRKVAKKVFDLSDNKFYILAGAENTQDARKGYAYFVKCLNVFWEKLNPVERRKIEILSVTRIMDEDAHAQIKFQKKHIPYIKDDRLLALVYQTADAYVNSSLEDSGPAMLMEAMACGVPVASFNMGAAQDYITNQQTGYVVENKNYEALAEALLKIFRASASERLRMSQNAFAKVLEIGSMDKAIKTMDTLFKYHDDSLFAHYKTISVALCTYNGDKYLAEQLDSILNQNLLPHEIVVCDDTSSDNTWRILESYKSRYPTIFKLYKNESRLGVVKNFEKAINLCTQEIIFLCDQDDVWYPQKTERVMSVFNRFPEMEAVAHNLQICQKDKQLIPHCMWDTMGFSFFLKQKYPNKDFLHHTMFFGNMVTGAALTIKKPLKPISLIDNYSTVIHDYQLAIQHLSKGTMHFLNENLGLYRKHEEQLIGPALDKMLKHTTAIRIYYGAKIPVINLIHILRREKSEGLFDYLKEADNQKVLRLIKDAKAEQLNKCFNFSVWHTLSKRVLAKLPEKLSLINQNVFSFFRQKSQFSKLARTYKK